MKFMPILFPFKRTFQHLELDKRWWHRLCVVMFFVMLFVSLISTAWLTFFTFAPQVTTMPEIQHGDVFDQVEADEQQAKIETILTENERAQLQPNVPVPPHGYYSQNAMTLTQFGQRIKAKYPEYSDLEDDDLARSVLIKFPQYCIIIRDCTITAWDADGKPLAFKQNDPWTVIEIDGKPVQPMIDKQGMVKQVPIEQVNAALATGSKIVVAMYDPQGTKRWIPEDEVQTALKAGGKFVRPIISDKFKPSNKIIQMPDGSTSFFSTTATDDSIKKEWNDAETKQIWKAAGFMALFSVMVTLFISYLVQSAYRALLYVIFGNTSHTT